MLFCLFAVSASAAQRLNVVASMPDLAAIAAEIAGSRAVVESLSRGDVDPHRIEPRPSMVMKVRAADLVMVIGMDLDMWMDSLIDAARNSKVIRGAPGYLDVSARIDKMGVPEGRVDGRHGHIHVYGNPHYWNSPDEGLIMAEDIYRRLAELSPDDAEYFAENYKAFAAELKKKTAEWKKRMEPYRGARLVLFHDSWPYFMRSMGLETAFFIEPQPGIPPSVAHVVRVIERMKNEGLKVIIAEPYQDKRTIKRIESETGAKALVLPPSVGGVKGVDTYIGLIEHNVSVIEKALGGAK